MIRRKVTDLSRYIILYLIRDSTTLSLNCIPNSKNQPAERIGHASWHFLSHRERKREVERFLSDYGISTASSPLSLCTCIAYAAASRTFHRCFRLRMRKNVFQDTWTIEFLPAEWACPSASSIEKSNQ